MKYYSRRELYAAGEMLGDCVTEHKVGGGRIYGGGGKGGGGGAPTQTTAYQTSVPEYARPYVETMLGATQKQLFNTQDTTDASGNTTTNITGFKGYQPYSTNPSDYVAGFSPLQQQAQSTAANMQMPGEYGAAAGLTGAGIMGSLGAGANYQRMATNPYAVGAYMNPYVQQALQPQLNQLAEQGQMQAQQAAGQATAAGAFGGTRSALQQNLAQRNALMAQQAALGQGYNQAFQQAQQAQQFGANLGLQGYGQALQGANQLANIGGQALQAQQGIANLQNTLGGQQQAAEQQKINQAIQDYATAQQYPLMQLGFMSNMLRGLPMQSTTTQQYQAQPSIAQQAIGLGGTAAMLGKAGVFKAGGEVKGLGYANRGVVDSMRDRLETMAETDPAGLKKLVAQSTSKEVKDLGNEILSGIALGNTGKLGTNMAGGGIIAFEDGGDVEKKLKAWQDAQPNFLGFGGDARKIIDPDTGEETTTVKLREKQYLEALRNQKPVTFAPVSGTTTAAPTSADATEKKDDKTPAASPAAPAASPSANPPSPGSSPSLGSYKGIADIMAEQNKLQGFDPNKLGEKAQSLMDLLQKRQLNESDAAAADRYLRGAQFFADVGSTAGPLGKTLSQAGGKFAQGEIAARKEQDKLGIENARMQADIEAGQRAAQQGNFKLAQDFFNKAEDRKNHIQVAQIQAAGHNAAGQYTEQQIKNIQAAHKARTGKDLAYDEALSRLTELKTTSDESKKQDMVKSAYTEASKSVAPGGQNYSQYKKLQEKDPEAAKKFVTDLATQYYQGMQAAVNSVMNAPSAAAPAAGGDIPAYSPEVYAKLQPGQQYRDPQGQIRVKG